MHKYNILFFSVLLFWVSCIGSSAPPGIIKEGQMISLLTELHIIDGSMYNTSQAPDSLYKYGLGKYLDLFKKFHTDSAQFRKSFKYYTSNPDELSAMYEQVYANIQQKSDSLTKLSHGQIHETNKTQDTSTTGTYKNIHHHPFIPNRNQKNTPLVK
jgi:hypothetical protein